MDIPLLNSLRNILGGPAVSATFPVAEPNSGRAIDTADLVSTIVKDVKDQVSSSLASDIVAALKVHLPTMSGAAPVKSDRPTIEKVFIDPSENVMVDSNIKTLGTEKTGANITDQLELFRKIKKGNKE